MVNPAITAALIATSRQKEVEEKIERRLRKAGAITQGRAIELDLDAKQQELLDQALAGGKVKRASEGRYYLNETAIADRKEGQGFMALLIFLVIASIIASVAVLMARSGG